MSPVLAADIGGTNIRMAVIERDGTIIEEFRQQAQLSRATATSPAEAEAALIDALSGAIKPLAERHGCSRLGIGFPGFFLGESGILAASPNLPLLLDFHLSGQLSERLGMAVAVQNDALCAAIGEHRFGAGIDASHLLHITLGTGVGAGLILNGKPYTGESGMAMEFGHLISNPASHIRCGCGNIGCLETVASATAVARSYADLTGEAHASARAAFEAASSGSAAAMAIFEQAGHALGNAIGETIKLLDVRTVTVSGGLTGAWQWLHPAMSRAMEAALIPPQRGKISILPSALDDRAGLLGAAAIAML